MSALVNVTYVCLLAALGVKRNASLSLPFSSLLRPFFHNFESSTTSTSQSQRDPSLCVCCPCFLPSFHPKTPTQKRLQSWCNEMRRRKKSLITPLLSFGDEEERRLVFDYIRALPDDGRTMMMFLCCCSLLHKAADGDTGIFVHHGPSQRLHT